MISRSPELTYQSTWIEQLREWINDKSNVKPKEEVPRKKEGTPILTAPIGCHQDLRIDQDEAAAVMGKHDECHASGPAAAMESAFRQTL